jgi:NAD(P)-dependent dehydrogenase (short-subunit alcohol dehydrogenase family)
MGDNSCIMLCASVVAQQGQPGASIYASTKAAIRSLARSWMLDLKDRHIRVNVISPGPIRTPGLAAVVGGGAAADGFFSYLTSKVPWREWESRRISARQ